MKVLLFLMALPLAAQTLTPIDEAGYQKLVSSQKGSVLVVDFWATWCKPCRAEMPQLVKLQQKLKAKGVKMVTISADEPEAEGTAKKFLAAYKKAGFKQAPTDYGPYAYDAANLEIAAAAKLLKGQTSIPADARSTVVTEVQNANTKGASGPIKFDQFGDTKQRVFTLYKVSGPKGKLAFVPTKP